MSFPDRPTIRIASTADLLALIPFILGFQPDDSSLVLVALQPGEAVFAKRDSTAPRWMVYRQPDADTLVAFFVTEDSTPTEEEQFRYTRQPVTQ